MKRTKLAAVSGRVLLTAASYRRVSRGGQDPANQLADIERVMSARGLRHRHDFCDVAGATKNRPGFDAMFHGAVRGDFKVLVVWAIDRLGRSMLQNCNTVVQLDHLGVQVISVREPWLDTRGPVRDLLLAIFSWVAEQERRDIIARTCAGLERARARGTRLGRPHRYVTPAELARAQKLWKQGEPIRVIAQRVRVPRATIHKMLVPKTGTPSGVKKTRTQDGARGASKKRTIGGR